MHFSVNNFVNLTDVKGDTMQQLLYFLLNHKTIVLLAMFGILSATAFANFLHNPYCKQNAQLKRFNKKVVKNPSSVGREIRLLPKEYQRQWRAYVNSGCEKPSTVFEFVKLPTPYLLWFFHFVATATSLFYLIAAILLNYWSLFTTQIVFLLLSVIILLVKNIIDKINLAHARKVFGRFLQDLNRIAQLCKGTKQSHGGIADAPIANEIYNTKPLQSNFVALDAHTAPPNKTSQPIRQSQGQNFVPTELLQKQPPHKATVQTPQVGQNISHQIAQAEPPNETIVDKAVRILRQKGLENPRTAEEQRKLNLALNNLLQACCKQN